MRPCDGRCHLQIRIIPGSLRKGLLMLVWLGTIVNAASVSCTTPERGRSEEEVATESGSLREKSSFKEAMTSLKGPRQPCGERAQASTFSLSSLPLPFLLPLAISPTSCQGFITQTDLGTGWQGGWLMKVKQVSQPLSQRAG